MAPRRAKAIRVLVVDDHRTFAEALAVALKLEGGLEPTVALSAAQAVELASAQRPDVVIMDVRMPGMDGIEAIRRIRETNGGVPVLVLSGYDEDLLKARAIEAGAVGYLSKEIALASIPDLVRRAHAGEILMEPDEIRRLFHLLRHRRHQDSTERQRANRLSPRQIEVLQLMADGVPVNQIAERLGVSPLTLRTHIQNILTRLAVHTKVEALAVAIRHDKITAHG
jgi:DNA-binding NarL/FixJ family response regulator